MSRCLRGRHHYYKNHTESILLPTPTEKARSQERGWGGRLSKDENDMNVSLKNTSLRKRTTNINHACNNRNIPRQKKYTQNTLDLFPPSRSHARRTKGIRRGIPRPHCIFIHGGRGFAAQLSLWRGRGGAKAFRCVRKRSSLTARAQHCSEKTDRESGGCKGWQYDPLLGGSDYNKIYTHIYACPGPQDRSYDDCRYFSNHLDVHLYIVKCLFYFS